MICRRDQLDIRIWLLEPCPGSTDEALTPRSDDLGLALVHMQYLVQNRLSHQSYFLPQERCDMTRILPFFQSMLLTPYTLLLRYLILPAHSSTQGSQRAHRLRWRVGSRALRSPRLSLPSKLLILPFELGHKATSTQQSLGQLSRRLTQRRDCLCLWGDHRLRMLDQQAWIVVHNNATTLEWNPPCCPLI